MTVKQKADLIAALHSIWIFFGVASLPLLFIIPTWPIVALVFGGVTIISWPMFGGCWFLQLENSWRKQHNPDTAFESEDFTQHYLKKYLGANLPRWLASLVVYAYLAILIWLAIGQLG